VRRPALTVSPTDMLDADGYLLGSPANLGYISGALKHAFDVCYYPVSTRRGAPLRSVLHGNEARRAERAVDTITTDWAGSKRLSTSWSRETEQGRPGGVLESWRDGRRSIDGVSSATCGSA